LDIAGAEEIKYFGIVAIAATNNLFQGLIVRM
jgi:hypothetical protein